MGTEQGYAGYVTPGVTSEQYEGICAHDQRSDGAERLLATVNDGHEQSREGEYPWIYPVGRTPSAVCDELTARAQLTTPGELPGDPQTSPRKHADQARITSADKYPYPHSFGLWAGDSGSFLEELASQAAHYRPEICSHNVPILGDLETWRDSDSRESRKMELWGLLHLPNLPSRPAIF